MSTPGSTRVMYSVFELGEGVVMRNADGYEVSMLPEVSDAEAARELRAIAERLERDRNQDVGSL